jgi:hypothetical protein
MNIFQCPHCNVFRGEDEPVCCCKSVRALQESQPQRSIRWSPALVVAEYEAMRQRLIELEEVYEDLPVRWRGSGEPIVNLSEEVHNFLKQKSEELRENERRAEQRHDFTRFSDN